MPPNSWIAVTGRLHPELSIYPWALISDVPLCCSCLNHELRVQANSTACSEIYCMLVFLVSLSSLSLSLFSLSLSLSLSLSPYPSPSHLRRLCCEHVSSLCSSCCEIYPYPHHAHSNAQAASCSCKLIEAVCAFLQLARGSAAGDQCDLTAPNRCRSRFRVFGGLIQCNCGGHLCTVGVWPESEGRDPGWLRVCICLPIHTRQSHAWLHWAAHACP